ncbi:MAG: type II methionyl aminopeptidase [Thermoprotei archaeon]
MDDKTLEGYLKAGKALARTREKTKNWVKAGVKYTDLVKQVEDDLVSNGVLPSFPTNVDVNEVAAHYTPSLNDDSTIPEDSIVKIDLGSHDNGLIADSAVTVSLSDKYADLVYAAEDAVDKALKIVMPGTPISEVGKVVSRVLKNYGFQAVANLTGHSIEYYELHGDVSIPNVPIDWDMGKFEEGKVYAIEPFVTFEGRPSKVVDSKPGGIYIINKYKRIKDPDANLLLTEINNRFKGLPFAERWLLDVLSVDKLNLAMSKLLHEKAIYQYPSLLEVDGRPVAQAEHTFVVTKDGALVTTE